MLNVKSLQLAQMAFVARIRYMSIQRYTEHEMTIS